jgi:hypothetical protein
MSAETASSGVSKALPVSAALMALGVLRASATIRPPAATTHKRLPEAVGIEYSLEVFILAGEKILLPATILICALRRRVRRHHARH